MAKIKGRRSAALKGCDDAGLAYNFHINCVHSFFSFLQVKLHVVAFLNLADQTTYVYKCFFVRVAMLDKTEAFFRVEKFDGTLLFSVHFNCIVLKNNTRR